MADAAYISRDYQRMWDLVRSQRVALLDARLITGDEYAALLGDETRNTPNQGSPSPRRLESYDELRARLDEAHEANARLAEERNGARENALAFKEVIAAVRRTMTEVMARLVPAISQTAIAGRTYGHDEVIAVVDTVVADLETEREGRTQAWDRMKVAQDWQREVAEGLGFLNQPEGQARYEIAEPNVILTAWRALQREREEAWEELEHARHTHAKELAEAQAEALALRHERDCEIHARVEAHRQRNALRDLLQQARGWMEPEISRGPASASWIAVTARIDAALGKEP